jgi:DNA ligase 1
VWRRICRHLSADDTSGFPPPLQESSDLEQLVVFMNDSVAAGTEGLIVKSLDSTYEPSRRSVNWLKLKKDYMDSVGDTFDVVPIGAWFGK